MKTLFKLYWRRNNASACSFLNTAYAGCGGFAKALLTKAPEKTFRLRPSCQEGQIRGKKPLLLVTGIMAQRIGFDSKLYSIQFELRLPQFLGKAVFAYQF